MDIAFDSIQERAQAHINSEAATTPEDVAAEIFACIYAAAYLTASLGATGIGVAALHAYLDLRYNTERDLLMKKEA